MRQPGYMQQVAPLGSLSLRCDLPDPEAVPVTFVPMGEARLDLYTDAMLLDIGPDTFVVPLDRLADLTAHRRREVVVSGGTGGMHRASSATSSRGSGSSAHRRAGR